jgi:hypothetical protein
MIPPAAAAVLEVELAGLELAAFWALESGTDVLDRIAAKRR